MSSGEDRAVLTLAAGKPLYLRLALNLAKSFLFWHSQSKIRFCIATDQPCDLDLQFENISIIRLMPGDLPPGFSAKLYVDQLAPARQTLFVDADCLCFGRLESVFDRFSGRPVGVVGSSISGGEWFGDVRRVLDRFGLSQMPKFNGGVYYLERGDCTSGVYSRARELEKDYDAMGLVRLRGRPNDELLMALAMALSGIEALPDDGQILGDPQACPGIMEVSVLRGRSRLVNPPVPDPNHQDWYPLETIHPLLVHFLGDSTSGWRYRCEEKKLALVFESGLGALAAELLVSGTFGLWARTLDTARNVGRPLYHSIAGPRTVKRSEREVS